MACDREPIHIPASIQPHGALLVASPEGGTILQAAGDTARLVGTEIGDLLDRPVAEVLGIDPRDAVRRLPLVQPSGSLAPIEVADQAARGLPA
jgi:two-component system, chemotaxis family, sensor kinase Cph1